MVIKPVVHYRGGMFKNGQPVPLCIPNPERDFAKPAMEEQWTKLIGEVTCPACKIIVISAIIANEDLDFLQRIDAVVTAKLIELGIEPNDAN